MTIKSTNMEKEHNFKVGDVVVITDNGGGTSKKDVGLTCQIVSVYTRASTPSKYGYIIEIDRDKEGNSDRYLSPNYIRLATPDERKVLIGEQPFITDHELVREANRRYPPGTRYWNLNMAGERSEPKKNIEDLPVAPKDRQYDIIKGTKSSDGSILIGIEGYGWVYANHKWAEIAYSGVLKAEIINNYQIY